MTDPIAVRLKPKHDRRVAEGHPWVFSNEIAGDVSLLPPGGVVDVFDAKGKFLGRGYANPRSLITVRILSRRRREDLDTVPFYAMRLREALALRQALYPERGSYRLVFGESDGLPGFVLDRYGDVYAAQITTLGMEMRKPLLEEALREVLNPRAVVLRNDAKVRELEGLETGREVWFGEVPPAVEFEEHGIRFVLDVLSGQKTGHFFDQADNKRAAAPLAKGRTVLDVYANTGGWALHALAAGAVSAVVIDSDAANCVRAEANAKLNGFEGRLTSIAGEAKRALQAMVSEGQRFGMVVLDPPAFAKQRKAAGSALKGYKEIAALGAMLVEEGGFFFMSSCSYHIEEARLLEAIVQGAAGAGRRLTLIRRGEQASDHPVLPMAAETRYLKCFGFRVQMAA